MTVICFNDVQVKAFIETCDNHVVEQAFEDTKHIVHDEFCDAVTSLRRTAHKELTHVEGLTKVFSEEVGPAVDQLAGSLNSYMQSECPCGQVASLNWVVSISSTVSALVYGDKRRVASHVGLVLPALPPSLLQCSPSDCTSLWRSWKVRMSLLQWSYTLPLSEWSHECHMTSCPTPADPSFLEAQDTAFSQLLSAAMSGFMEQLGLALSGEYNPAAQHTTCAAGSEQWLTQLAHIGVLVAMEAPMKGVKVRGRVNASLKVEGVWGE